MMRVPVESSSIAAVGYDAERHTLEVEFAHGAVYQYLDVPAEAYAALMAADSKGGRFLNAVIRGAYACVQIAKR